MSAEGKPAPSARHDLLLDLDYSAGPDRTTALTDSESQALFHGDRLDQLYLHLGVVTWQHHLGAFWQVHDTGHVGGAEVELRAVVVEERRVPPALVLGQDVDLRLELGVRSIGAWLDDDLAALHFLALDAAEQQTGVVTCLALVEDLVEHLDTGHGRLLVLLLDADDLNLIASVDHAALDPAGDHGAAAGDREHVLDRHEEGLLGVANGLWDRVVAGIHQSQHRSARLRVALECLLHRYPDHRDVVAREFVDRQQLAYLKLDELKYLLVVDHVGLVQRH